MRCLARNKTAFKYIAFVDSVELMDVNGNYTGEQAAQYGEQAILYGNISRTAGNSELQPYGTTLPYERTIVMEDIPEDLTENAGVWIDDLDAANPDYVVKSISKSLNSVTITVRKVYTQ